MIKRKVLPKKNIKKPGKCPFCEKGIRLDYKEPEVLKGFITERGKISSREYTGVCTRHQRQLAKEVKRARLLALLPFVNKIN